MTFANIKKTREFLKRADSVKGFVETDLFVNELKAYYGDSFFLKLKIYVKNTVETYDEILNSNDRAAIKSFLEATIEKNSVDDEVNRVLELIDEGEKVKETGKRDNYIQKIYTSFYGTIEFDDQIKKVAEYCARPRDMYLRQISTDDQVDALQFKLYNYAKSLMNGHHKNIDEHQGNGNINVNISNSNSNNVDVKVDTNINVVIEEAKKDIENLGLSDYQTKEVIDKLDEIKGVLESKEERGKRWKKIKSIFGWIAEQGFQVASIVVPLIQKSLF